MLLKQWHASCKSSSMLRPPKTMMTTMKSQKMQKRLKPETADAIVARRVEGAHVATLTTLSPT